MLAALVIVSLMFIFGFGIVFSGLLVALLGGSHGWPRPPRRHI